MGWEAAESVAYEYDRDGRLVSSRVTRDIEWDDWQRALTLAAIDLERSVGPHGHPKWEAENPTAEDPNGEYRYVVEPVTDYVDRAISRAEKAFREAHKDDDMSGITFHAKKVYARE